MDFFATPIVANPNATSETLEKKRYAWNSGFDHLTPEQRKEVGRKIAEHIDRNGHHKSMLGKKHSEETKNKMRGPRGKFSDQARKNMSESKKGIKKGPLSATAKANISAGSVTAKPMMTPNGVFPSKAAVARAANRDPNIISKWMKRWPEHYFYLD